MEMVLTGSRAIVHLNVADFAAAVERLADFRLRDRPIIVAAPQAARALVFDLSEEAYQSGVRKGMVLSRAQRLCPEAFVVAPRRHLYERAMSALTRHALPYSPLVEAGEADGHLFLDLTGTSRLFGPPQDAAWRMRQAIRADLRLEPIWSLAANKLVAKVASRLVKPAGEYVVAPGEEEKLLQPLPVGLLPGLEREDLLALVEFNIVRVGQLALWSFNQVEAVFGRRGLHLYRAVRGVDDSPVLPAGQKGQAIRLEHEFPDDTNETDLVEAVLYRLVERAGFELRERGLAARRVGVALDYSDGVRLIRQRTERTGTASDFKLFALAKAALEAAWVRRTRLRHLRLICDRLTYPPSQLELFPEKNYRTRRADDLLAAIDRIRRRFGPEAIRTGRTLAAGLA